VERFGGVVESRGGGGGRVVTIPLDVPRLFGRARAPVRGRVNGAPFRSTVAVYAGVYYLGLNRELREAAGVDVGDAVEVEIELDDAPREVDVPAELAAALASAPAARARFESLSHTHRREYARWIAEAKREETRRNRADRAVAMLADGVKTPDAR
jgi:hypothetical protein